MSGRAEYDGRESDPTLPRLICSWPLLIAYREKCMMDGPVLAGSLYTDLTKKIYPHSIKLLRRPGNSKDEHA
jgi:hypothetical protein